VKLAIEASNKCVFDWAIIARRGTRASEPSPPTATASRAHPPPIELGPSWESGAMCTAGVVEARDTGRHLHDLPELFLGRRRKARTTAVWPSPPWTESR